MNIPGNNAAVKNAQLKYIASITPVVLLLLLVLAVVFYRERMLYIDAPHILFRIINDGRLWTEEYRYGAVISQVLPFAGSKLHLSLRSLMILYSADFYAFYLIVSLLLVYVYRNYGLAILLGLYFTLFVSDTFYWANNEVHPGIVWLMLAFAINFSFTARNRQPVVSILLFIATFALAIWTHPLVMLAAVYLWFFFMTDKALWPYGKIQSVTFSIFLLLLSYVKFYQGLHHGYDNSKLEVLSNFPIQKIKGILASPQLHFFLRSCIHQYKFFLLVFIAGLTGALVAKKYVAFIWTLLFAAGYLVLTCITFWDVDSRSYMESEYMPLVIICCTTFVYYALPKIKPKFGAALMIAIYAVRLTCIYFAAFPFTARVVVMENILQKMKAAHLAKIIICEPVAYLDSALITNWAAPVESIFISKLNGDDPQRTFIFLNKGEIAAADTIKTNTFLGAFEKRSVSHVNSYYFQLDTTSVYKIINSAYLNTP